LSRYITDIVGIGNAITAVVMADIIDSV